MKSYHPYYCDTPVSSLANLHAFEARHESATLKTPKINHVACPWLSTHLNPPLNRSGLNHLNDDHEMLRHRIAVYDELYAWRAPLLGETHT
jgi:hypothetical protein